MAISLDILRKVKERQTTSHGKYQQNNFTNSQAILQEEWRLYQLKRCAISIDFIPF